LLNDVSKLWSKWMTGQRSQKLMSVVLEAMTEARQKVRASDSPFRSLARKCIDQAEDSYQEALYQLKDGEPKLCFQYCKQGLKFLSMAMMHLSDVNGQATEPIFDEESDEQSVIDLSESIARFKTSVEYTNCEVTAQDKERLMEVVSLYFDAVEQVKEGDSAAAANIAQAGLLYMYLLGREMEDKLRATIVDQAALERCRGAAATRIVALVDQLADTQKQLLEASVVAQGRIKLYMDAARRTIDQCIVSYLDSDSDDVSQRAKAGAMELRMANRLIDYAKYPGSGPEPEDDMLDEEELDEELHDFKRRVARLQRLLKDTDEDAAGVVRRLGVVSSYFARARRLLEEGDYSEAERYARSAHLDIDFARQLLSDKHATYSDLI
jgi:hypothetical protein